MIVCLGYEDFALRIKSYVRDCSKLADISKIRSVITSKSGFVLRQAKRLPRVVAEGVRSFFDVHQYFRLEEDFVAILKRDL